MNNRLLLLLFFCGSIKVTYAVDIVFDPQAFSKLLQQVQEARKMAKSLEEKLATHRRVLAANCGHQVAAYREFPNQFQLSSECTHLHDSLQERRSITTYNGRGEGPEGWKLGDSSRKYESNGNSGKISSGEGDNGGKSYGSYQLSKNKRLREKE